MSDSADSPNSASPPGPQGSPGLPRILIMWSAPRSRSTAFFRMMAERGDFIPVHEPFSYLAEFGYATVGKTRVTSEAELIGALRDLARQGPVFVKDTTDERYPGVLTDLRFLAEDAVHTFLVRHPRETIASYQALNPEVALPPIGCETQHEIFSAVARATGHEPVVMDSEDLLRDPAGTVAAYCARVGIEFRPDALTWKPDDRQEWAPSKRWHAAAAASTGFGIVPEEHGVDVRADPVLSGYLRHHLPFYEKLSAHRLPV
jgi:hypothetical protein